MSKINSIDNKSSALTIDPGASGDSFVQFDINTTGKFRIGVDDTDSDAFVISQGSALGTDNTFRMSAAGECTMPLQSAFSGYLSSTASNVTGDGTQYTVAFDTEVFDQNNDFNTGTYTFEAPVTGRYNFNFTVKYNDIGVGHTGAWFWLVTSNRTHPVGRFNPTSCDVSGDVSYSNVTVADMDASDTAYLVATVNSSTLTVDVEGGGNMETRFGGFLIC